MRGERCGQQSHSVTDADGYQDVGGGKEDADQFAGLAVRGRVQQKNEHRSEADENADNADDPAAFALLHLAIIQEDPDRDQDANQIEFVVQTVEVHQDLFAVGRAKTDKPIQAFARAVRRADFLILTAGKGVDEPFERSRIAPLHRGVAHAGNRHVQVEGHAEGEGESGADGHQPMT